MKVIREQTLGRLAPSATPNERGLEVQWLEGPTNTDRLDVGHVTVVAGGVTPPHVHLGGQVIIALSGRGFVATDDQRAVLEPGDVVIAPPGELHTHGAAPDSSFAHLTVTTGPYDFPGRDAEG